MLPSVTERRLALLWMGIASLGVLWLIAPIWRDANLPDDAFITLTYAKNLAAGRGFVFNHPPATLGTTTPLLTLLVAALSATLGLSIVTSALTVGTLAWLASGWLAYLLLRRSGGSPLLSALVGSAALLLAREWLSFFGMELQLFQACLMLSIYLAVAKREALCGISVAALTLVRGEGALVALLLFGYLWYTQTRFPLRYVLPGLIVAGLWSIYALALFGSPIPNTLAAKQIQMELPGAQSFARRMVLQLIPDHLRRFSIDELSIRGVSVGGFTGANTYLVALALGGLALVRRSELVGFRLLVIWVTAYGIAYTVLDPKAYAWYVLHPIFVLQVLAGVGLAEALRAAMTLAPPWRRAAACLGVALLTLGTFYPTARYALGRSQQFPGDSRAAAYRALAAWLRENTSAEESVAFVEIGYLGFFSQNRIVDMLGLVDPSVLPHLTQEGPGWSIDHYQPDYYVDAPEFSRGLLAGVSDRLGSYREVARFERNGKLAPLRLLHRETVAASPRPSEAKTASPESKSRTW